ncbi:hypothetical protein BVRB_5g123910 [Beta vulgaris subsp. vulgaris]|nr:hypothetical protein BVRB_5g123910 [Beta vulgaris subsp. vulgaris]
MIISCSATLLRLVILPDLAASYSQHTDMGDARDRGWQINVLLA